MGAGKIVFHGNIFGDQMKNVIVSQRQKRDAEFDGGGSTFQAAVLVSDVYVWQAVWLPLIGRTGA